MTDDFAFKWAYSWLAIYWVLFVAAITLGMPLPHSTPICLVIGAVCGAIIVGPIVYTGLRRS